MNRGWKSYLLYSSIILVIGGLIYILFETVKAERTGFETKTLWDWMELLIIPAVLAGGAILLNRSERALERKTAEDRAKLERDLATDRQQEAALQTYFDRMSELLLKEKLRTTENIEVRDVARTRTLSIMRGLDTKRNALILQFLTEAKLITDNKSIFNNANMSGMNMKGMNLQNAFLQGANLVGANLQGAFLQGANLVGANLQDANLQSASLNANLQNANLQGAFLQGANLVGAFLQSANLVGANLAGGDLQNTHLQGAFLQSTNLNWVNLQNANLQNAKLQGADLQNAKLQGADLQHANLQYANLQYANLQGADLQGADLSGVNLSLAFLLEAKNITNEQLVLVKSLKGATMLDGTKHD